MILILSDKNDSHSNFVLPKIKKQNLPVFRLNLDVLSLKNTSVTYRNFKWTIIQENNTLELEKVQCVWNRRTFVELLLDEEYDQSIDFKIWKGEWNKTLLGIYSTLSNLPWLNFWRDAYAAENKFLQMEMAHRCEFLIPDTIVSNNKNNLLDFLSISKVAALKLMQQDFYKSQDKSYKGFYVNVISGNDLKKFGDFRENPVVLQEYIDKDYEVRYTVVGQKHFACRINSQESEKTKIDWRRYDIPNTPHLILEIPSYIEERVRKLMILLKIEYGALDFIVTKNNDWFFLEVNSMGQFLWIEDLTGLPISNEIINWLKQNLN